MVRALSHAYSFIWILQQIFEEDVHIHFLFWKSRTSEYQTVWVLCKERERAGGRLPIKVSCLALHVLQNVHSGLSNGRASWFMLTANSIDFRNSWRLVKNICGIIFERIRGRMKILQSILGSPCQVAPGIIFFDSCSHYVNSLAATFHLPKYDGLIPVIPWVKINPSIHKLLHKYFVRVANDQPQVVLILLSSQNGLLL